MSERSPDPDILGRGWAFPIQPTVEGDIKAAEGEADVRESIRIILGTAKGERVMRPSFGCGIHEYAFETVDTSTLTLVETTVEDALTRWEPRIDVQNVEASAEALADGRLDIEIEYRVRRTNSVFNLVYPFYLEEG